MNLEAWGAGTLTMILFWGIVVVLALLLLRVLFTSPHPIDMEKAKRSPTAFAKERYARGEISRGEYQTIVDDLEEM